MKIKNINLEEHLTSSYGEEYWMSVTVSYYGTIRTVKRLVLLDREAHNIEELELLVHLQYYQIEEHDNLFQLLFARHFQRLFKNYLGLLFYNRVNPKKLFFS